MNYYCATFYTNISTNMDTTNIFQFLSIFEHFFFISPQKVNFFLPFQLDTIAYIVSKAMNYNFAKFYAFIKNLTIDVIFRWLCYVAVCNNYAICNKLQTALNCNAVCNKSYFKLRCDGNAIYNVLQIASKYYHLKILKMRKKIDQRQNSSLQSYLTMNSARHQSIRVRHAKLPMNTTIVQNAILPPHFCEIEWGL